MDPNQVKLSHGHFLQVIIRCQCLLAAYRIVPTQVCHHSSRCTRNTLLLLVQSSRSYFSQSSIVFGWTLGHSWAITTRKGSLDILDQAGFASQTSFRLQNYRWASRYSQFTVDVFDSKTDFQFLKLGTALWAYV